MVVDECRDLSLKLLVLGKRFGHEYLRPAMLSGMNMVDPLSCLLSFLGDEHRGISYSTRYLNEAEKGYSFKW